MADTSQGAVEEKSYFALGSAAADSKRSWQAGGVELSGGGRCGWKEERITLHTYFDSFLGKGLGRLFLEIGVDD
jgi:hypothetical protein